MDGERVTFPVLVTGYIYVITVPRAMGDVYVAFSAPRERAGLRTRVTLTGTRLDVTLLEAGQLPLLLSLHAAPVILLLARESF
jgi:hypothetical protein